MGYIMIGAIGRRANSTAENHENDDEPPLLVLFEGVSGIVVLATSSISLPPPSVLVTPSFSRSKMLSIVATTVGPRSSKPNRTDGETDGVSS